MTIKTDATAFLVTIYQLHDLGLPAFQLADTSYKSKTFACAIIALTSRLRQQWAEKACSGIKRWDSNVRTALASRTDEDAAELTEAFIKTALATLYGPTWGDRITLELPGDPHGAMVKLFDKAAYHQGSGIARAWA